MSLTADQLYALLPAIYRTRDAGAGGPLQALTAVLAEQLALVDDATQQLYANQFIETCSTWAIPYLGDLIGVNPVHDVDGAHYSPRAEVANTIGYRRRKGTLLALEQLSTDVSGRASIAVEEFHHLITTQSMRLVRPRHTTNLSLRSQDQIERIHTAFDSASRTIDVRRIAPRSLTCSTPDPTPLDTALHGGGRCNIPNLAVYLWRWKTNRLQSAPALSIDNRRFMLSPLGQDMPLFNQPADRQSFERLTTRYDVAQPIRRHELALNPSHFYSTADDLSFTAGGISTAGRTSISLTLDGSPIPLTQLCIQNLSDRPDGSWPCTPANKIGLDPELSRVQLGSAIPIPIQLTATFSYGTPALIGGGPYDRSASLLLGSAPTLNRNVTSTAELTDAITAWNALPAGATGQIVFAAVQTLTLSSLPVLQLPPTSSLTLVSAKSSTSPILNESLTTLMGSLSIAAPELTPDQQVNPPLPGSLIINGLWISGQLNLSGGPATINLSDTTLVPGLRLARDGSPLSPGQPSILIASVSTSLSLTRCVTGPILAPIGNTIRICCSIVDACSPCAVAYAAPDSFSPGPDLHIEDCTVIGKLHIHTLTLASNTIFHGRLSRQDRTTSSATAWAAALWCARRQSGCVRFCWLPTPAITPRQYECLPPAGQEAPPFAPRFISLRFGHPSYCLLSGETPLCILKGASDAGEIGAFNSLQEWQAFRNVQIRLAEYMPFALEAGIFLVPSRVEHGAQADRFSYGKRLDPSPCGDGEEVWLAGIGVGLI